MERFVVSRELAERLRYAGYPQEITQYHWYRDFPNTDFELLPLREAPFYASDTYFAAPLSDELLEQLPDLIKFKNQKPYWLRITPYTKTTGVVLVEYIRFVGAKGVFYDGTLNSAQHGKTLPDALAEIWMWCKEHGYLEDRS